MLKDINKTDDKNKVMKKLGNLAPNTKDLKKKAAQKAEDLEIMI